MFRTLIILAAVVVIFMIVKNRLSRRQQQPAKVRAAKTDDMTKCLQCETYIPKKEAIISGSDAFCCPQHLRDWEQSHKHNR